MATLIGKWRGSGSAAWSYRVAKARRESLERAAKDAAHKAAAAAAAEAEAAEDAAADDALLFQDVGGRQSPSSPFTDSDSEVDSPRANAQPKSLQSTPSTKLNSLAQAKRAASQLRRSAPTMRSARPPVKIMHATEIKAEPSTQVRDTQLLLQKQQEQLEQQQRQIEDLRKIMQQQQQQQQKQPVTSKPANTGHGVSTNTLREYNSRNERRTVGVCRDCVVVHPICIIHFTRHWFLLQMSVANSSRTNCWFPVMMGLSTISWVHTFEYPATACPGGSRGGCFGIFPMCGCTLRGSTTLGSLG